jgi:AcrR family transcriptional regulator
MSPRETTFSREAVFEAAVAIVREKGLENLTARAIATRLKASVAPVYSTFGSMASLQREVLQKARSILLEKTGLPYTEDGFLNIGVGMVVFARDEAGLFRSLFHTRHHNRDILDGIFASILDSMKADPAIGQLTDASRQRLLDNLGTYTLGLAAAVVYGQLEDASNEVIIRHLMDVGSMMIFGEVTGTADCASPESEKTWERVLKEKKIILPPKKEKS